MNNQMYEIKTVKVCIHEMGWSGKVKGQHDSTD